MDTTPDEHDAQISALERFLELLINGAMIGQTATGTFTIDDGRQFDVTVTESTKTVTVLSPKEFLASDHTQDGS